MTNHTQNMKADQDQEWWFDEPETASSFDMREKIQEKIINIKIRKAQTFQLKFANANHNFYEDWTTLYNKTRNS